MFCILPCSLKASRAPEPPPSSSSRRRQSAAPRKAPAAKKAAAAAAAAPRGTAARGRARPAKHPAVAGGRKQKTASAPPPPPPPPAKKGRGPSAAAERKKKDAANKKTKKRNSSDLDDSLFKDVQVVLDRIRDSPAEAVSADEVFDRLEEVKRSPLRVDLVSGDLVREAGKEGEKDKETEKQVASKTPAAKKKIASKRVTRSCKKVAPPSPVKGELEEGSNLDGSDEKRKAESHPLDFGHSKSNKRVKDRINSVQALGKILFFFIFCLCKDFFLPFASQILGYLVTLDF